MPDEVSRALGMDGGGFSVLIPNVEQCEQCSGEPCEIPCAACQGAGVVEDGTHVEWILSDLSFGLQSRHTSFLKGRLRGEKISQQREGLIKPDELREELSWLDEKFSFGHYSLGGEAWQRCLQFPDVITKLYQLLLEQHHPEVAKWSLEDVQVLVESNEQGFVAALGDILPKAIRELRAKREKKVAVKTRSPLSKSAPSCA